MLTVVLVIMLISTVVYSNLASMHLTSNFYDKEAALMAANSGMNYAITRLQNDIAWNGCGGSAPDSAGGSFQVQEENGNVIGIITSADGRRSVFRIKFNYEDGAGGLDGLDDTPNKKGIASPFVSVNNLAGPIPAKVYTANADGTLKTKTTTNDKGQTSTKPVGAVGCYSIPKFTCDLIVEGFSGRGTREATLENPIDSKYSVSKNVVEAYIKLDASASVTDSVVCAAGSLTNKTGSFLVSSKATGGTTNLRALNEVTIDVGSRGTVTMSGGTVYYGKSFNSNSEKIRTGLKSASSKSGDNFLKLKWEDIPKADASGNCINAGSYIWMKQKGSKTPVLMYFPQSYAGKDLPTSGGVPVNSGTGMTVYPDKMAILFDKNTYVKGGATKDLVIRSAINEYGTKPIVGFIKSSEEDTSATILTCGGNVTIKGLSVGNGAITAEGDINMQGPSILESDPGLGVSYYSKGDINITRMTNTTKYVEINHPRRADGSEGPLDVENAEYDAIEEESSTGTDADDRTGAEKLNDIKFITSMSDKYLNDFKKNHATGDGCAYCRGGNMHHVVRWYCNPEGGGKGVFMPIGVAAIESTYMAALAGDDRPAGCTDPHACGLCSANPCNHKPGSCPLVDALNAAWEAGSKARKEILDEKPVEDAAEKGMPSENNADKAMENYIDPSVKTENYDKYKRNQLQTLIKRYGNVKYSDQDISGVMYAWRNINIRLGKNSRLHLTGAMVAYGQDPKSGKPISNGTTGNVTYKAQVVDLNFDPNYMTTLSGTAMKRKLKVTMYGIY